MASLDPMVPSPSSIHNLCLVSVYYNANTTTTTSWEVYYVQFTYTTIPSYSAKRDSHSPIQKVGAEAPNTTCSTCLIFAQLKVRFYIILVPPPLLLLYITAEVYLTKPKKDTLYLSSGKYYFFKVHTICTTYLNYCFYYYVIPAIM